MIALHDIGAMLRSYRKRLGLSASELAQRSGIHRNTLSALERGQGNVELNTLLAICEQLELDLSLVPARVAPSVHHPSLFPAPPANTPAAAGALHAYPDADAREQGRKRIPRVEELPEDKRRPLAHVLGGVPGPARPGEPTPLQRRINARLAMAGIHSRGQKK